MKNSFILTKLDGYCRLFGSIAICTTALYFFMPCSNGMHCLEANWSRSTLFAKTGHVVFSKRRVIILRQWYSEIKISAQWRAIQSWVEMKFQIRKLWSEVVCWLNQFHLFSVIFSLILINQSYRIQACTTHTFFTPYLQHDKGMRLMHPNNNFRDFQKWFAD